MWPGAQQGPPRAARPTSASPVSVLALASPVTCSLTSPNSPVVKSRLSLLTQTSGRTAACQAEAFRFPLKQSWNPKSSCSSCLPTWRGRVTCLCRRSCRWSSLVCPPTDSFTSKEKPSTASRVWTFFFFSSLVKTTSSLPLPVTLSFKLDKTIR